jgi:CP family cyanate transporter-like MFS transporter
MWKLYARQTQSVTSTSSSHATQVTATPSWMVLTAVSLVAVNLRPVISSLPTVAIDIVEVTGWNSATIGVLTTIPVLCMGLFALAVPALAMHFGRKRLVIFALIALTAATLLRAVEAVPELLFLSAFLAGVGIAFAAGLIPGIVREQLPHSIGKANSTWTASLASGAALGGALTVPLALWLGSWSLALALWAVPALIALAFWLFVERKSTAHDRPTVIVRLRELPWRNKIAWALALNMTCNSIIYYSSLAWIAPSYEARGWTQENAGWLFGLFTISQVVAAFLLAGLAVRINHRRALFVVIIGLASISLFTIAWLPDLAPGLVLLIFGFVLSGSFAMTLGLLSEYSRDSASAARLTAMVFFITYTIAAAGPLIAGTLLDFFDSWSLVFTFLGGAALLQLLTVIPLRRGEYVN